MDHPATLTVEQWPTERPKPYPRNARRIPESAIDKLCQSILTFGFNQPIVVDEKGVVIVGHTRLFAARKLELPTIPVVIAHLTAAQARAYRLMDNRCHEEGSWNTIKLSEELRDLQLTDIDLGLTGFDTPELDAFLNPQQIAPAEEEEELLDPVGDEAINKSNFKQRIMLSWGDREIPITEDEVELLDASYASFGVSGGWIEHILGEIAA